MVVFADSSFAGNPDFTLQLGYIITLSHEHGNSNVIHYSSTKAKRITRSLLEAELYAVSAAFDSACSIKQCVDGLYGKPIPVVLATDSRLLFELIIGLASTTEKRLLIDLTGLRDAYELRELGEIYWVKSQDNPSDGLTKLGPCEALQMLIKENKINFPPSSWVERKRFIWENTLQQKEKNPSVGLM